MAHTDLAIALMYQERWAEAQGELEIADHLAPETPEVYFLQGVVYRDGRPLYAIAAFTDGVPALMPDGTPGYTIALETIGKLSQACWRAF